MELGPEQRLGGVVVLLQVYDMPVSIDFYCRMLGFAVHQRSADVAGADGVYFHWAWLKRDGVELMLNTAYDEGERPPARDAARERGHADVEIYIGCADADRLHAELAGRGLALDPPRTTPYGLRQLQLTDPDGYAIRFESRA